MWVGVWVCVWVGVCVGGCVCVCVGAPLRWVDVVSKDLTKLTNWQEVVKDRAAWRAFIHRP